VYDFDAWSYHHRERLSPPQGIIFKLPKEFLIRQKISFKFPWDDISCVRRTRVDILFELSFKIFAILCENFVRRTFSSHPDFTVVNWHFRQFVLAHYSLVNEFNWPPKLALWVLPRLPTASRWVGVYPPDIHHNTCPYHIWFKFEKYLRLRC